MAVNPLGAAVPVFLVLIVVEFVLARLRGRSLYRLPDTMTNIGCGMIEQLFALFVRAALLAIYVAIYDEYAIRQLASDAPWTWVLAIVGVDFCYYWYHRFGHRTAFGWAAHSVHHQSEDYNLAVALRQSALAKLLYGWVFYLPLAVIGVPPQVYLGAFVVNLLYQFWIHTQLIGTLGPFEWLFNTPSHHRVHHGTNPEYIDKNYAGIFIVWDRLFGTFEKEKAPVLYGILKPPRTWDVIALNIQPYADLARHAFGMERLLDKVLTWLRPPGWQPGGVPQAAFPAPGRGYDRNQVRGWTPYIMAHLGFVVVMVTLVMLFQDTLALWAKFVAAAWVVLSVVTWAALFEGRRWGKAMELVRVASAVVAAAAMTLFYVQRG